MEKRKRMPSNRWTTFALVAILLLASVKLALPKDEYNYHSRQEEAARLEGNYTLALEHANEMVSIAMADSGSYLTYIALARRGSLELLIAQGGDEDALQYAMSDYSMRYTYSCDVSAIESQLVTFGEAGFPAEGQEVMFAAPCQIPLLYQALSFAYLKDTDSVLGRMIEFGEGNFPELTDLSDAELWVVFRIYTVVGDQQMVTQINGELAKRFPPQR